MTKRIKKILAPLLKNPILLKDLFGEEAKDFELCMTKDEQIPLKYFYNIYADRTEKKWLLDPRIIHVNQDCKHVFRHTFETLGTNVMQYATCAKCNVKFHRFVGRTKRLSEIRVLHLTKTKPNWDKDRKLHKSTDVQKYEK